MGIENFQKTYYFDLWTLSQEYLYMLQAGTTDTLAVSIVFVLKNTTFKKEESKQLKTIARKYYDTIKNKIRNTRHGKRDVRTRSIYSVLNWNWNLLQHNLEALSIIIEKRNEDTRSFTDKLKNNDNNTMNNIASAENSWYNRVICIDQGVFPVFPMFTCYAK